MYADTLYIYISLFFMILNWFKDAFPSLVLTFFITIIVKSFETITVTKNCFILCLKKKLEHKHERTVKVYSMFIIPALEQRIVQN
jgi:hypothetical protein